MTVGTIGNRVLGSGLAALAVGALPAHAATTAASAEAVTLSRLSLVKTEDLDFGTLISGTTAGTATINANTGARTTTGGVTPASGGPPKRAEFVGIGGRGILIMVAIGASPTLSNGTGGTMPTALTVQGGTGVRLFPGTGVQTFRVGGRLNVAANQPSGDYAGTFTLTVTYF
jgi:spore coat protein U-like protein